MTQSSQYHLWSCDACCFNPEDGKLAQRNSHPVKCTTAVRIFYLQKHPVLYKICVYNVCYVESKGRKAWTANMVLDALQEENDYLECQFCNLAESIPAEKLILKKTEH